MVLAVVLWEAPIRLVGAHAHELTARARGLPRRLARPGAAPIGTQAGRLPLRSSEQPGAANSLFPWGGSCRCARAGWECGILRRLMPGFRWPSDEPFVYESRRHVEGTGEASQGRPAPQAALGAARVSMVRLVVARAAGIFWTEPMALPPERPQSPSLDHLAPVRDRKAGTIEGVVPGAPLTHRALRSFRAPTTLTGGGLLSRPRDRRRMCARAGGSADETCSTEQRGRRR